jgi:glycosyltransferase involved in cell wall biosynthesis
VKIGLVVQRYGADINGGAELHARYIAEHLARHVEVEVLTTCASDYISWRNERAPGVDSVHGVAVRRFPVERERDPARFGEWSERVFTHRHSLGDELTWLDAEGPTSPELVSFVATHANEYDFFVFFSFRYYHAYHGARAVPHKAILVPTAERDGALGLGMFAPVFRGVRAVMYNSHEERALIHAASRNEHVPGVVVGVGSAIPDAVDPARFRHTFQMRERFAIYVGRIDENKGCRELFDFYRQYAAALLDPLHLVLIGTPVIPIPSHAGIRHLGFISDQDKFDAMAAADLLIMPSYFESLSMVALEAWALGRPVLANARCDVLHGQCLRSNGGLFYDGFDEFFETLRSLDANPGLAAALGQNGRRYFERHYSWPVIEGKYTGMLDRLAREPARHTMEPPASWWARRRRVLPPADEVVNALPRGAWREARVERTATRGADERRLTSGEPIGRPQMAESNEGVKPGQPSTASATSVSASRPAQGREGSARPSGGAPGYGPTARERGRRDFRGGHPRGRSSRPRRGRGDR